MILRPVSVYLFFFSSLFKADTFLILYVLMMFSLVLLGERGVHSPPADVLPGTGLLRPVHVDPEQRGKECAAAHWDHLSFYSIKDGGNETKHTDRLMDVVVVKHCLCLVMK